MKNPGEQYWRNNAGTHLRLSSNVAHLSMLNLGHKLDQRRKNTVTLQSELSSYIVERYTKYLPAVLSWVAKEMQSTQTAACKGVHMAATWLAHGKKQKRNGKVQYYNGWSHETKGYEKGSDGWMEVVNYGFHAAWKLEELRNSGKSYWRNNVEIRRDAVLI